MAIHQDVQCAETPDARKKPRPILQSKPPGDGAFYPLSILCIILSAKITASRNVPAIKQGGFLSPSFPRRAQPVPCSGRPTAVPSLGRRARQRSDQQVDRPL